MILPRSKQVSQQRIGSSEMLLPYELIEPLWPKPFRERCASFRGDIECSLVTMFLATERGPRRGQR